MRPSFDAPNVSRAQMQEMHNGRLSGQNNAENASGDLPEAGASSLSSSVDALIQNAQQSKSLQHPAQSATTPHVGTPPDKSTEEPRHPTNILQSATKQTSQPQSPAGDRTHQVRAPTNGSAHAITQPNGVTSEVPVSTSLEHEAATKAPASTVQLKGNGAKTDTAADTPKTKKILRHMYSDSTQSPEEKMARMPRYAWQKKPKKRERGMGAFAQSV